MGLSDACSYDVIGRADRFGFQNFCSPGYKHSKCQHCLKTFDGADAVLRHCVLDQPDKYVSWLWPLLNYKCGRINDIGRGPQGARGTEKEGGREETRTEGRKDGGRKGGERDKRRGEGEEMQAASLNRLVGLQYIDKK